MNYDESEPKLKSDLWWNSENIKRDITKKFPSERRGLLLEVRKGGGI